MTADVRTVELQPGLPASAISRRTLLKAGGAIAVVGAVGGVAALTRGGADLPLARASFAELAGERFAFSGAGLPVVRLVLEEVADLAGAEPGDADRYAAVFRGAGPLPQGTYEVQHSRMGRFALFVVPGQAAGGQPTVRATFNAAPGGAS